jgi:hypothetical protein
MTEQELERVAYLMASKNKREALKVKAVDGRLKEARAAKALEELIAFDKALSEIEAHED